MNRFSTLLLVFLAFNFIIKTQAQKEQLPPGFENLPKLTERDSMGLVNLPELTLPEWLKGTKATLLPEIVDNSEHKYWRPVFAQVQYECGQAAGVGLGFTYAINRMRNLPSDVQENQYPSHFTWNFGNGGDGWYGVSYFHSFEIIKREGCPNVIDFGGMTGTGPEMWMTGYDKYYNAMHNRIADVYKIDLTTEDGINTLRNWIHNHLEGADFGGVANFYTNAPYSMPTLPAGTPEAGKFVVTGWSSANHGLTISGYHDSIRWDYNNDGQYTNDIDINGDGIITPRDWEIGGFRFANTYSGGPAFGNNGFSYMTYKSCADPYGGGGIWDNAAHVVYAKAGTEPLLTAKIGINYNCRNRIRIQMGMSTDINATSPDHILGFPVFDYQGGCQYMQGGTTNEDHKIIEFGLDITPFLNMIESGTPARYFLLINEKDPEGWGWGSMINYSIVDYTGDVEEVVCTQSNVTITNDDLSTFWVNHIVDYDGVEITSDTLTPATVYEPYTDQLEATGGTEPYIWSYDMNFTETMESGTFPMVIGEDITPSNAGNGYSYKELDFVFPFYDYKFDYVRVYVDGYIAFENMFDWPYSVYDFFNYTKNKLISPFQANLRLYTGDGIWYEGDENSATFRWKASVDGYQNTSDLNIAVQLFSNGDIKYFYGDTEYPEIEWISGLSSGDNIFYQFTEIHNDESIPSNTIIDLEATQYPEGFEVDRFGEFSGTAIQTYSDFGIKFLAIDENNLIDSKVLNFTTDGSNYLVVKSVSVMSGGDEVIEFGEITVLTLEIESLGEETISGAEMAVTCNDEYISLIDSTEILGDFEPGEVITFSTAFAFQVANNIPNEHEIVLPTLIEDDSGEDWTSNIYLMGFAPDIYVAGVTINDGAGGSLDPGETADLIVGLQNVGGAMAENIEAVLSSVDPYITINSSTYNIDEIEAGGTGNVTFNVTASENTPPAYIIEFDVELNADNDYYTIEQAYVVCGLLMEGFESGNFNLYPWTFGGNENWIIDNSNPYEGSYCAQSGDIGDDQTSVMQMELYIFSEGEISFFSKVSSEAGYDYLRFYIDGNMKDQWEGEQAWSQSTFPVTPGLHVFIWEYYKDGSVSSGQDCAWVDNITIPAFGDEDPQLLFTPDHFVITVDEVLVAQDTLMLYNGGTGPLLFSIETADSLGNPVDWIILDNNAGGMNPGDNNQILVWFDGSDMEDGLYHADIILKDHIENEFIVPVWFYVDLTIGLNENKIVRESKNIPNPFRENTSIQFYVDRPSELSIDIYNQNGERIKRLANDKLFESGVHQVKWNAETRTGEQVNSGIYYYRIISENETLTGKMILMN